MKLYSLLISHLLFLAFFSSGCEKEEPKSLPDITSTGKNTLGCYVNKSLFVHTWGFDVGALGLRSLVADYDSTENKLYITSHAKRNRFLAIVDSIIEVGKINKLMYAEYRENNTRFTLCNGEIILSKFDIDKKIVSGTFSFYAKDEKSDSTVHISEGRFDIQIYDY